MFLVVLDHCFSKAQKKCTHEKSLDPRRLQLEIYLISLRLDLHQLRPSFGERKPFFSSCRTARRFFSTPRAGIRAKSLASASAIFRNATFPRLKKRGEIRRYECFVCMFRGEGNMSRSAPRIPAHFSHTSLICQKIFFDFLDTQHSRGFFCDEKIAVCLPSLRLESKFLCCRCLHLMSGTCLNGLMSEAEERKLKANEDWSVQRWSLEV